MLAGLVEAGNRGGKRMVWVRRVVIAIILLGLLAAAILYAGSEMLIRRRIAADLPRIQAATSPADIAEGARLARIEGCLDCHGKDARGRVIFDQPQIARIMAPALARVAETASDEQIARAIRNGIGTDARPLFVMPTQALNRLSDQDVARLIGWMRTIPTTGFDKVDAKQVGPLGRIGLLIGQFQSSVNQAGGQPRHRPADTGRYLVETVCMECHLVDKPRIEAGTGTVAPPLAQVVAAYDPAALRTLLRTGKAAGNRELGLMSQISRGGLYALTDPEIDAIQAYLKTQLAR